MPHSPRFSIVIPMLGIEGQFDDTLASVLRNRPENSEVIVVHDGTYEDPYLLRQEVHFVSADSRKHLVRFFNAGVSRSRGEIVTLLRPGIEVPDHWESPVSAAFEDPSVGSASPAIVSTRNPDVIVARGVSRNGAFHRVLSGAGQRLGGQRRKPSPQTLGPTSWAAFYRKSVLDQIGPVDARLDQIYLDIDIALTMAKLNRRSQFVEQAIFQIGFPQQINRELTTPHGLSAQRAILRHSDEPAFQRGLVSFVQEVVTSPFATWKFNHAFERLSAGKFKDSDLAFAEKIRALHNQAELDLNTNSSLRRAA